MIKVHHKEAFERISDERRNSILNAGIEEFAQHGYEKANINVIAQKAGISIGLMYKYFKTKEDLFITCVDCGMSHLDKVLQNIMESDDKLLIKAEKLIRATCSHSRKNKNYIKIYNEIAGEKNAARSKMLANEIESRTSVLYIDAITTALEKGDVRSDLNPRLFAFFLDNLLLSLQFSFTCDYYRERFKIYYGIDVNEIDDEEIVTQLLKFIESAFTFEKKKSSEDKK